MHNARECCRTPALNYAESAISYRRRIGRTTDNEPHAQKATIGNITRNDGKRDQKAASWVGRTGHQKDAENAADASETRHRNDGKRDPKAASGEGGTDHKNEAESAADASETGHKNDGKRDPKAASGVGGTDHKTKPKAQPPHRKYYTKTTQSASETGRKTMESETRKQRPG